ncbi:TPA: hypothetical protein RQK93_004677 [Vibrio vulnificus]|nr:hypothetical protein [Vibrio vulnificus]HAS6186031.1 hypothetical protein [Vibrio vulnificus]HAS6253709.1 hypothetical protein [Vibrio vulnificus]HAS6300101.1 hypothetical protein [Vibrio vulnificus]HAT8549375.1 hypothetical protein [Vibrio vulnificus]
MDLSGIKIAVISGVFALMGSAVTGYFLVQGQEAIARKDLKINTSEIVKSNHETLRQKSEDFVTGVYDYFLMLNDAPTADSKQLRKAALELQKKAFVLSVYSSPELGVASMELAAALGEFPDSKDNMPKVSNRISEALSEWHRKYYIETSSYNLELMPEASFKKIMFQYLNQK